jgi:hypothetical protein
VFPSLLGWSFNPPPERIAVHYGMTFAVCCVITFLRSVLLLRLPISEDHYGGNFAVLLAVGHLERSGLGAVPGTRFVASSSGACSRCRPGDGTSSACSHGFCERR